MRKFLGSAALVLSTSLLAACGGGGTAKSSAPSGCGAPMPASPSTSSIAGIVDPLVENELATTDAPSLTIEIARAGTPIYVQAYGQQNLAACLAAAATTPYQIGSITKQFTAAAVLTLVESGKVDLDTPVVAYLADYQFNPLLTVRMLLNQTSGLQDFESLLTVAQDEAGVTEQQVLTDIVGAASHFSPGTAYEYSNSNYFVLGVIIERVSGATYGDYLQAHVLTPAGLMNTSITQPANAALPYSLDFPFVAGTPGRSLGIIPDPSVLFSAGELWSTVGDLTQWDNALFGGKVIDQQSLIEMLTAPSGVPTYGQPSLPSSYAMGWVVSNYNGYPFYWHNGKTLAYTAYNGVFSDTQWTLTILTNLDLSEDTPLGPLAQSIITSVCPVLTGPQSCT
jgi:D-alanyl-D-alanine carboxypeptidase